MEGPARGDVPAGQAQLNRVGGGCVMAGQLRLVAGLTVLDQWSEGALQCERNSLYKALFAVADGSVFVAYEIMVDNTKPYNFMIRVKEDLVAKIRMPRIDAFAILGIGPHVGDENHHAL
jgi:hypothetical protein